jgi:hypothetical protein
VNLGIRAEPVDFGDLNKIIDPLSLVFEVEARVLQGVGKIDDGLSDFVDLLVRRDL